MDIKDLLIIAKSIYPEGIPELENLQAYNNSPQHRNLVSILTCFEDVVSKSIRLEEFISDFKELGKDFHFHDVGRFQSLDRCLNFQLTRYDSGCLHSICFNLSAVVPYYTIYVLSTEVDESNWSWKSKPTRNLSLELAYKDVLEKVENLAKKHFLAAKFPEEYLDTALPNINRAFIDFGKFNLFNAFFLDEYYTLL